MNGSFCSDFFANLFADFLAGLILAVIVAYRLNWWVNKKLNELERSEERKAEERAGLKKAIRYLELLKDEIDDLVHRLRGWIEAVKSSKWGLEFWIATPRWDILQPSGELPGLLDPDLVVSLTLFYDRLMCAKQGKDWLVRSWLVPLPGSVQAMGGKRESFKEMILYGLEPALKLGRELLDELDSEIRRLKEELRKR